MTDSSTVCPGEQGMPYKVSVRWKVLVHMNRGVEQDCESLSEDRRTLRGSDEECQYIPTSLFSLLNTARIVTVAV